MASNRGFVLPTIAILLLIMSLVVSSLLFRSLNRTTQVIGERNQQVVYNAATPAIDRAKAKIEFLFRQDPRFPGGLPSDRDLDEILKNTKPDIQDIDPATAGVQNPYDFPDETRIDINNDGVLDNAWSFRLNTGGDGNAKTIAYSILTRTVDDRGTASTTDDIDRTATDSTKAPRLIVRNGPINLVRSGDAACQDIYGAPDAGWDQLGAALVRRAFQVTALAIDSNNTASRTVATLEMQQDRQAERGNKWGAWFRNDLEIFPGPLFRWNGSMHTEGNLIIGGTSFNTYLISSPRSCLYTRENSEITVGGTSDETTPPFLGQIMSGSLRDNAFESGSSSNFDIYGISGKSSTFALTPTTDSTNLVGITPNTPTTISLDPVVLFTTNQNRNRNGDPNNKTNVRDVAWKDRDLVKQGRVINKSARAPYVDDTYRADDRYGPKPQYNDRIGLNNQQVGTTIPTTDPNYATLTNLSTAIPDNQGLDGYWERRAWAEGLRVIVGQRLELGNTFGWLGANDPLYPPVANAANGSSMQNRAHEQRQWKTMRDNLAAVQSTALYHNAGTNRNFPIACLATTAHPGTQKTIANSTTFRTLTINSNQRTIFDFLGMRNDEDSNNNGTLDAGEDTNGNGVLDLRGQGTDGWEFNPPATDETAFATAIASGRPLRIALENLAHFAGDGAPDGSNFTNARNNFGAFPARQDTSTDRAVPSVTEPRVHPDSNLTMWGDYSNLRRVIQLLNSGTSYNDLSLADKTTLQTASCTLGMLAYNLQTIEESYREVNGTNGMNALGVAITQLMDGIVTSGNPEIGRPAGISTNLCTTTGVTGCPTNTYTPSYFSQFSASEWINAIANSGNPNQAELIRIAQVIQIRQQIERDRSSGFQSNNFLLGTNPNVNYSPITGTYTVPSGGLGAGAFTTGQQFNISCDPNTFSTSGGNSERAKFGLSQAFCSRGETVRYPSLFYLFPKTEHFHDGTATTRAQTAVTAINAAASANVIQPLAEPYANDPYIFNNAATDDVNGNYLYRVIADTNNGIEDGTENSIDAIAIQPRTRANWTTPNTTTMTGRVNRITDNGTPVAVGFLDKGIFNGRESMSVRVLDFDLDLLRRNSIGGETWLPNSGIIYAFREDAVREDGIARRAATTTWASCDTAAEIVSATCRMNAVVDDRVDPPLNPTNGISPKPVDFYADPDRRPHGFRLRKGADLRRVPTPPPDFALRGLAFISDNPVYIQGDDSAFNLHQTGTGTRIEEFTNLLGSNDDGADWNDFYTRTTLNPNFARAGDSWRPAEIIADAISLLSPSFVDGSIAQGIRRQNNVANIVANRTSYHTLNAPKQGNPDDTSAPTPTRRWVREDGSFSSLHNAPLPIKISRNGFPIYCVTTGSPATDVTIDTNTPNSCTAANSRQEREYGREATSPFTYMGFNESKYLMQPPDNVRINATLVSGTVPSRAGQSYGGMHNFPRFLENWGGRNLHIAGAFIQLNFSTSATAPFDQEKRGNPGDNTAGNDGWEPNNTLNDTQRDDQERIFYYSPPLRRWGYDVGLQYSPAGPVAKRFVTPSNTRSEFYRELPLDDPYVRRLRCASVSGVRIDPQATCP
jgi:hypothetical protein